MKRCSRGNRDHRVQTAGTTKFAKTSWIREAAWLTIASLFSVASAHAHPGHDLFAHGASHIATSPFHWIVLASLSIAFAVAIRFVQNKKVRTILGLSAGACAVLTAILVCSR